MLGLKPIGTMGASQVLDCICILLLFTNPYQENNTLPIVQSTTVF